MAIASISESDNSGSIIADHTASAANLAICSAFPGRGLGMALKTISTMWSGAAIRHHTTEGLSLRKPLLVPPGINSDDTTLASSPAWADGSNVRFRLSKPQVIGGWESLMASLLTGVCRTVFPWTDNSAVLNIAFGTHSKLSVWQGGALYDITPFGPPTPLGSAPFATTNGSAVVTVTQTAHGRTTGDSMLIAGAVDTNGITAANLNGTRVITVTTVDAYTFTAGGNATSTGTGGGTAVIVTPQVLLPAGATDGTSSIGYGTGAYGGGPYGQTTLGTEYYPRTWSLSAWGQTLLGTPRGGGLYQWNNATGTKAVAVTNAPTQITYSLVAPMNGGYMAFALGCNEEASGTFNPMAIRHCSVRTLTQWSTLASGSTAREYILTGGGRIVAGRMIGPYLAVWTNDALWLGTFVGALNQPWRFDRVGRNCGLIGPNAVVVVGQTAYWISPDKQIFSYGLGGEPQRVVCPILVDFADNLAASQGDKIVASSNALFGEVRFDYPDARDGYENSRYLGLSVSGPDAGSWHRGIMARTAFVDAGPTQYPLGVTYDGHAYFHEKGTAADGSAFSWFIQTADVYVSADYRALLRSIWPDFQNQIGAVTVAVTGRATPQDPNPITVTASPLAPGDTKADVMIDARLFRIKFSGNSAPTRCRIGDPVLEFTPTGTR